MTATVYLPGDYFTVGLVVESWQRPGTNRGFLEVARGQLWERVAEAAPAPVAHLTHETWSWGCTVPTSERENGDGLDAYAVCPVCEPVEVGSR
jgi:hypothetical protein